MRGPRSTHPQAGSHTKAITLDGRRIITTMDGTRHELTPRQQAIYDQFDIASEDGRKAANFWVDLVLVAKRDPVEG